MKFIISLDSEELEQTKRDGRAIFKRLSAGSLAIRVCKNADGVISGRRAEHAFARYCGLDPRIVLQRVEGGADHGADFNLDGVLIDVKSTGLLGCLLVFEKYELNFERKEFDVLVLVIGAKVHWEIVGWITKARFRELATQGTGNPIGRSARLVDKAMLAPGFDLDAVKQALQLERSPVIERRAPRIIIEPEWYEAKQTSFWP